MTGEVKGYFQYRARPATALAALALAAGSYLAMSGATATTAAANDAFVPFRADAQQGAAQPAPQPVQQQAVQQPVQQQPV
nr:hypothetical protein [Hyphomicrobiales bacterium]